MTLPAVLLACGAAAAMVAGYTAWSSASRCLSEDRVLTRSEIIDGAIAFSAGSLRQLHQLSGVYGSDNDITAAMVRAEQPDCCTVTRDVTYDFAELTENVRQRFDASPLRAFVKINIDNPALLPASIASDSQTIGIDVCGRAIQNWLDLSPSDSNP